MVILGAGVMGASVAYHLAARGARDILVIDRGRAPARQHRRATGGFRAQYGTPINVRQSLLAREKLRRFREEIGVDSGYEQVGYLWLAMSERELAILDGRARCSAPRACTRRSRSRRTRSPDSTPPSRSTASSAARSARPRLHPSAGHSRRLPLRGGAPGRAHRVGRGSDVAGPRRRGSRHRGEDGAETIPAGVVVNAAGAWAGGFACSCGVDAPVMPLRRQVARTVRTTRSRRRCR